MPFDATWCGRASIDARSAFVTGELLLLHPSVRSETAAAGYVPGVLLHIFIALSFAAFYYAASRRLTFLTEHRLVCGLFNGAAVEQVMNLVVLPLSALHARGPYQLHELIEGLLVHMFVVGLPISFSVRRFARAA